MELQPVAGSTHYLSAFVSILDGFGWLSLVLVLRSTAPEENLRPEPNRFLVPVFPIGQGCGCWLASWISPSSRWPLLASAWAQRCLANGGTLAFISTHPFPRGIPIYG